MSAVILRGDAAALPLADESVDLIVTSPPYFGLRSYTDGGEHYSGQIGSEATPREFLEALWACTREWMRVLKPEGSLFVNFGDSYATPGASVRGGGRAGLNGDDGTRGRRPFRQRIGQDMTREDAAWLAGVIDSDGSVSVHVNKQPEGRAPSFVAWVRIGQKRPEVVRRAAEITGTGQVYEDSRGVWNWSASAQQARWVLARIYPWLLIKKRQAAAAIEVARHVEDRNGRGSYRPLTHDDIAYRQRLQDAVRAWNKSRPDDLVVPEPAPVALPIYPLAPREKSLHGIPAEYAAGCVGYLGLILRAEIIWSKPNGLPESVTDRVRRSHEQVFHFTRQPRYFSAVDEVREAHAGSTHPQNPRPKMQSGNGVTHRISGMDSATLNPLGKLPGSVWEIPSQPLTVPAHLGVDHFAAFPMELPRRIILGWSPSGICTECGQGRRPVAVASAPVPYLAWRERQGNERDGRNGMGPSSLGTPAHQRQRTIAGYACACTTAYGPDVQSAPPTRPAIVLDPFGGTGTTALVASAYGRTGISVDRSADYCRLARWRTTDPAERARAMQVPKPPPVMNGQEALFDGLEVTG